MRWFIGLLAAVVATAAVTTGAAVVFDLDDDTTAPTTTVSTAVDPGLSATQTRISGTVTVLSAENALVDPLLTPLSVETPERGAGAGATIQAVLVDGAPSAIVWDAGRPLTISGECGAMLAGPVRIDADAAGLRIGLDGPVHGFTPATYHIDTPVAVGADGLGRPADSVTFDATDATTAVFAGGATVALPPMAFSFRGPGRLTIQGTLEVATRDGTRPAASLTFGGGPFEILLTPVEGGFTVSGLLDGPVETTP